MAARTFATTWLAHTTCCWTGWSRHTESESLWERLAAVQRSWWYLSDWENWEHGELIWQRRKFTFKQSDQLVQSHAEIHIVNLITTDAGWVQKCGASCPLMLRAVSYKHTLNGWGHLDTMFMKLNEWFQSPSSLVFSVLFSRLQATRWFLSTRERKTG